MPELKSRVTQRLGESVPTFLRALGVGCTQVINRVLARCARMKFPVTRLDKAQVAAARRG